MCCTLQKTSSDLFNARFPSCALHLRAWEGSARVRSHATTAAQSWMLYEHLTPQIESGFKHVFDMEMSLVPALVAMVCVAAEDGGDVSSDVLLCFACIGAGGDRRPV